jgi:hypothetical protein
LSEKKRTGDRKGEKIRNETGRTRGKELASTAYTLLVQVEIFVQLVELGLFDVKRSHIVGSVVVATRRSRFVILLAKPKNILDKKDT